MTISNAHTGSGRRTGASGLARLMPALTWLRRYRRDDLPSDMVAGIVTAIMLIPQSMAYAQLAGLPPQIGLYASVVPLAVYALFGTSGQLSVGPVAITALAVASGVGALAPAGDSRYLALVLLLAVMVGLIKLALGMLRLGFVLNFVSHPVLTGFTSASALIIAAGQLKYLLGYQVTGEHIYETLFSAISGLAQTNLLTLAIGGGTIALLLFFKYRLRPLLRRAGLRASSVTLIASGAPLLAVLLGILAVWGGRLDTTADVSIVGDIPRGFGPLTIPAVNTTDLRRLLPTALTIVFISVVESIAVAKSLASKRRQVIDANQELVALGLANIAAGLTSGFPVTGGFSRSVVNYEAGAVTGLASLITAAAIGLIVLFFTPLFYYLPQAVLAATVVVAVLGLFNPRELLHIWKINRGDAVTWGLTFGAVLLLGIEVGILVGVATSIMALLWRASRPHIAIVGRLGESEIYRNILRHQVKTCPHVVAVRVDESLYFANTKFLEDRLLRIIAEQPAVKHLVLVGTAINFIDASAMETLESLLQELRDGGVALYLAAIKGPVMDRLVESGFVEKLGADHIFLSTHDAMLALECS